VPSRAQCEKLSAKLGITIKAIYRKIRIFIKEIEGKNPGPAEQQKLQEQQRQEQQRQEQQRQEQQRQEQQRQEQQRQEQQRQERIQARGCHKAACEALSVVCGKKKLSAAQREKLLNELGPPKTERSKDLITSKFYRLVVAANQEAREKQVLSLLSSRGLPTRVPLAARQAVDKIISKDLLKFSTKQNG
jgi:transcription initiation factor TFIID subunit TAF12